MLKEDILDICDEMIIESFDSKINRDIDKVEKALRKANKAMNSSKVQKNPEAKAGAKKVIKELEKRKDELEKIKEEQEKADKDAREAKTEEAKKKAELRKIRAEKAYKKFMKAKDPINMICNILKTATGMTAVISLLVMVAKATSFNGLAGIIGRYIKTGGRDYAEGGNIWNREVNDAIKNAGEAFRGRQRY